MRIIDKGIRYNDYYDGLQAPQDSLIYTRDTLTIQYNITTLDALLKELWLERPTILGFCGYLYLVWVNDNNYCYSPSEMLIGNYRWDKKIINLSNPYEEDHTIFHQFKVPCFLYNFGRLITNPCLKDLQFYKVKDAYQTYQELDMYIGGVLANTQVIPPMGDLTLINARGFDAKTSFRMTSPGKKYNRRNNK
jgi:hypothetical protein